MRRCPDVVPAGEIVQALALKPSTASVYLSALTQAGLISQQRNGTQLLYGVNLAATQEVMSDLFMDCCRGRADLCPPAFAANEAAKSADTKLNVLFVCTGNSARSILAETILRDMAGDRFNAYSAGTAHRSALNPMAVAVLKSKGHELSHLQSKNIGVFQSPDAPVMDFIFTVCDRAANEDCPPWSGPPVSGHWGMPDPVKATGTQAEINLAFQQTYGALHNRLAAFTALDFAVLDRRSLQKKIDTLARLPDPKD